jgi:predicted DNA-binding protein
MKTISIRIGDDVKQRWDRLADEHRLDQSSLMREAILEKLEELEDFYVVKQRSEQPFTTIDNETVWKRLGIEG